MIKLKLEFFSGGSSDSVSSNQQCLWDELSYQEASEVPIPKPSWSTWIKSFFG